MKTSLILFFLALSLFAHSKTVVNDVTQLNPIEVESLATPKSIEDVQKLVRQHSGPISIGGGRFSMGGQIASENTLHLDMRQMDKIITLSPEAKTITVQAGITWRKIQEKIDPFDLSIKIMQSYANFTVGGSLSVNVHGRYVGLGPLVLSVRSIKIVMADGSVVDASPSQNPEIFYGAIGGYGGIGVIVEATLDLEKNDKIQRHAKPMKIHDYKAFFDEEIKDNAKAVFHNADIYPPDYERVMAITWEKTESPVTVKDRLMPTENAPNWIERVKLFGVSDLPFGKELRASLIDPLKVKSMPVVWRNYEASYDVHSLEPNSRQKSTYVLQEYFVPVGKFDAFTPKMARIFKSHKVNVLNVSIRHAKQDPGTLLAWAREDSFAFVVYYKQGTSKDARDEVAAWTRELIDAAISVGGTYYLPYQIVASDEQFRKAYPRADEYFALKKKVDPTYKFRNKLLDRYYKPQSPKAFSRPEENSFLTLPEWYVVYSADDFANHLKKSRAPSDFPFFSGVGQFWNLYSAVAKSTWEPYPFNFGTHLMIGVVGASFTAEYIIRGIYENTVGRATEWACSFGTGPPTAEDQFLIQFASEYSAFIHETPWYAFPFTHKLKELWELPTNPQSCRIRGWERRFEGLAELAAKSSWSWLIGLATKATYAPEDLTIQVLVKKADPAPVLDSRIQILDDSDPYFRLLQIPRYQAFTEIMTKALRENLQVETIAGNRKIVLSLTAPSNWKESQKRGEFVNEMDLLVSDGLKRVVLAAPVADLHRIIPSLESESARIEHIYDY